MDYKIDLHTHSLASGHAYNTIYEMVEEAKKKALDAKIIETEAKETARAAAEARDIALKAAKEAAKASEYATKQAEAAKLKCQQIEAEAKKKLAALRGKTDIGR